MAGRAYYGAFWATCIAVCRKYRVNPPRNLPHEALCNTLAKTTGDEDVRLLGTLLGSLRLTRLHADYKLLKVMAEDRAEDAVNDAGRILELIPTVQDRLPKVDPQ